MKQVGIFTATRWELDPICRAIQVEAQQRVGQVRRVIGRRGNCRLYVFQTGVGTAKAGAVCREVLADRPLDLAVSSGFACALTASHIGDLLIGTEVLMHEGSADSSGLGGVLPCAAAFNAVAIRAGQEAGVTARAGRFITVSRILWRAEDKRRLATETGTIGLDMESAAVGAATVERQIPFLVLRTVSDLLDEDLPLDFNLFLTPAGRLHGALTCLARPSSLIGLYRLRVQSALASERMTRFFERFLDAL